jgi:uncharacterized membrane protein
MNYVATAQVLGLHSADVLSAGMAADNLVMTLFFFVLFALPSIPALRRFYPERLPVLSSNPVSASEQRWPTLANMAAALSFAAAACAAGYAVESLVGWSSTGILWTTMFVVVAATASPRWMQRLDGAEAIGTLLMQVFFATIGASANIGLVVRVGPALFAFAAVVVLVHLVLTLLGGLLLRLDLAEIVIASNANVGGPTTAAAMATSRKWNALVIPAILCGTLGYAVATFIGVAVGRLLAG